MKRAMHTLLSICLSATVILTPNYAVELRADRLTEDHNDVRRVPVNQVKKRNEVPVEYLLLRLHGYYVCEPYILDLVVLDAYV